MKRNIACLAVAASALLALPLAAAAATLTPGLYEYTIKMNMPGMPANAPAMPAQVMQHCLTAKDIGSKGYGTPPKDSDCQIQDMNESGGQFSYKISCTKPQKMDGTVKGSATATSMTMDTTMSMGSHGTMTQSTTAKRIGDCKQ
jgi:Protein of unknown function (DUF3617)